MAMREVGFTGGIYQEGDHFVVRAEMTLPTKKDAEDFASWIQEAVRQHIVGRGGFMVPDLTAPLPGGRRDRQ